jgi:hypothetical protein
VDRPRTIIDANNDGLKRRAAKHECNDNDEIRIAITKKTSLPRESQEKKLVSYEKWDRERRNKVVECRLTNLLSNLAWLSPSNTFLTVANSNSSEQDKERQP